MRSFYIAATESRGGKTAVALGLCIAFRARGIDAGYFKPIGTGPSDGVPDEDAVFVAGVLDLPEDAGALCPLRLADKAVLSACGEVCDRPLEVLRHSYREVARGHDLVVCEGLGEIWQGRLLHVSGTDVVGALDLPVLLVARFAGTRQLDDICYVKDVLRHRLKGVVFTMVPETRLEAVEHDYVASLAGNDITCYGVLPTDRQLAAVPVGAMAEELGGTFLAGRSAADRLADSYLIGAMGREYALAYFERTPNKVVVVGADRDDLIRAALATPTVALVLTGTARPDPATLAEAERLDVAVIAVPHDTVFAADGLRRLFGRIRVHERSKIERIERLIDARLQLDRLMADLA